MVTIARTKSALFPWGLMIGLSLSAGPAYAGDHGYYYHAKVHQHGTLVAPANVGTVVHTTNAQVPMIAGVTMVAAPQVAATHYLVTTSVPTYNTNTAGLGSIGPLAGVSNSAPLLQSSQSNTAGPMLRSAGVSNASTQATADYVPEYNLFLQQESLRNPGSQFAAAGVRTHPADIAALNQNHSQLVAAVGADRLGSFGRFLLQKLGDPNFRNNAIKLFEPLLGTFLPQYAPLIDTFLNDLTQGSGNGGLKPLPINGNGNTQGVPAGGGTFNATGSFPGVIVLTPVGNGAGPVTPPIPGGPIPQSLKDGGGTAAPSP